MKLFAVFLGLFVAGTAWAEAGSRWHVAKSDHFVIYSGEPIESLRAYAEKLERFDALLRSHLKGPVHPPSASDRLTIYALPDVDSLHRVMGPNSFGVGGVYRPSVSGSIALTTRFRKYDPSQDYTQIILLHEYAHHFMLLNLPAAYPSWYIEGYAKVYAASRFAENGDISIGGEDLDSTRQLMARQSVSITDMMYGKVKMDSYFEARGWLLTHYLMLDPSRNGQLDTFLSLLATGKSLPAAADEAFGDLQKLNRDVSAYLNGPTLPYTRISAATLKPGTVTVSDISPGEAAMMDIVMNSRFGVEPAEAHKRVAEARRIAALYSADPAVQCALAAAEDDAGNPDETDAAADRLLAIDPKSFCAMIFKGKAAVAHGVSTKAAPDDKIWTEARRRFSSALRAEPENPWSMWLYYCSYWAAHAAPTIDAIALLYGAQQRAPQDSDLSMFATMQLLRDGRTNDARVMMAPFLAYGGDTRYRAAHARLQALYDRIGRDDARSLADAFDDEFRMNSKK